MALTGCSTVQSNSWAPNLQEQLWSGRRAFCLSLHLSDQSVRTVTIMPEANPPPVASLQLPHVIQCHPDTGQDLHTTGACAASSAFSDGGGGCALTGQQLGAHKYKTNFEPGLANLDTQCAGVCKEE